MLPAVGTCRLSWHWTEYPLWQPALHHQRVTAHSVLNLSMSLTALADMPASNKEIAAVRVRVSAWQWWGLDPTRKGECNHSPDLSYNVAPQTSLYQRFSVRNVPGVAGRNTCHHYEASALQVGSAEHTCTLRDDAHEMHRLRRSGCKPRRASTAGTCNSAEVTQPSLRLKHSAHTSCLWQACSAAWWAARQWQSCRRSVACPWLLWRLSSCSSLRSHAAV